MKQIDIHSYEIGIGGNDARCQEGPKVLRQQNKIPANNSTQQFNWGEKFSVTAELMEDKYADLSKINNQLAQAVINTRKQQHQFLVLGGDQSASIGTWSGAVSAHAAYGKFGLLWVDAHMDSHTPQTSPSGNIHGMPLAALLGFGDQRLTSVANSQTKLSPEHVCLVGIRSYETGEAELLNRLGVRIYFMDEINQRGISVVMKEAMAKITRDVDYYGISIDLDAFDPKDAPGVGYRVPNGIHAAEFCQALAEKQYFDQRFMGAEIVEYNPERDENFKTAQLCQQLISHLFSE